MPNRMHDVAVALSERRARGLARRGSCRSSGTHGRLTLQGALRFDLASSWFPEQTLGPSKVFAMPIVFPATKGVNSYRTSRREWGGL